MHKPAVMLAGAAVSYHCYLSGLLEQQGYRIVRLADETGVLNALQRQRPRSLIIGCSALRSCDYVTLARRVRQENHDIPIILIAEKSCEELAIDALKAGVTDYFKLPLDSRAFLASVRRCCTQPRRASHPETRAIHDLPSNYSKELVGECNAIRAVKEFIAKVAMADSNVLITGETGTGKELVAELVHTMSARRHKHLVCVNCAAIPDSLLESELFGYEKGAFTGAQASQDGKFELADGGTTFLDEIGDMSPISQAKILRAIETKHVHRLGGKASFPVNFRVVAATNQNLEKLVSEGQFRKDLFFRLNVARIQLPSLKDRKEDINLLCDHFIRELNPKFGLQISGVTDEVLVCLKEHAWPGNVRELKNVVETAFINRPVKKITIEDLPDPLRNCFADSNAECSVTEEERDKVLSALLSTNWNKSKAAKKLNWSRMTLYRKIEKYHINDRESEARNK